VATVFSRIIAGELPGTFVWRDDRCVAFMSINPIAAGLAQRDAFDCRRVGVIIAGYEVPHLHVHVIPTNSMADVAFANAAEWVDSAELEAAAEAIRVRLRAMDRPEVAELTR